MKPIMLLLGIIGFATYNVDAAVKIQIADFNVDSYSKTYGSSNSSQNPVVYYLEATPADSRVTYNVAQLSGIGTISRTSSSTWTYTIGDVSGYEDSSISSSFQLTQVYNGKTFDTKALTLITTVNIPRYYDVIINFRKDAGELDLSCSKAYWLCRDSNGYTPFPVGTGEAYTMGKGSYTLYLYSGETEFADPDPITITIDGTENRIEREVILQRKKVRFSCRFYNTAQKDNGILPNSLGLDQYCTWRISRGEWHASGESVEISTGSYTIEVEIDERIQLMAYTDIISLPITLDGSESEHTEYINVLGANGAKVDFNFSILISSFSPNFTESKVDITLRNSSGNSMTVPAGQYVLPKGNYTASFSYRWNTSEEELWWAPNDIAFNINGRDREFALTFVEKECAPFDWSTVIWFDANGGETEATVLRYIEPTGYDYTFGTIPEAHKEGYVFLGWFSSKNGGVRYTKDSFIPRYDDSGIECEDVNNERRIHLYAHWKKVNITSDWLSSFTSLLAASNGDVEYAGSLPAANGKMIVADCFDVGVNPEDPDDDFRIIDFMMVNGEPVFELNHTTNGSGESFLPRIKKLGKADLKDDWSEVPPGGNPAHHFFTIEVETP